MQTKEMQKFIEGIKRTGFVLEHEVANKFSSRNWQVISNRYYIDDAMQIEREIDLLVYKVSKLGEILIYTVLVISCKKSDKNVWAFLARPLEKDDPNLDHVPIHFWSNHKVARYMLANEEEILKEYIGKEIEKPFLNSIYELSDRIFAFQELDKKEGQPKDDKAIYQSIATLVKAYAYETNSLDFRKKDIAVYNFHLLSVFNDDFIKIKFSDQNQMEVTEEKHVKYLNRHIVNKKDLFFRIHFISLSELDNLISNFESLHTWNFDRCEKLIKEYYSNPFKTKQRIGLFEKEYFKSILWYIKWIMESKHKIEIKLDTGSLEYSFERKKLLHTLEIDLTQTLDLINSNQRIHAHVKRSLNEIFHYDGDFEFIGLNDLPF